jgi:hypothetical protein
MDEYDSASMLILQGVFEIWDKMRHALSKLVNLKAYQQLISIYFEDIMFNLQWCMECCLQNL